MSPLLVLKYVFAGVLMTLFFLLFGAPAVEKYQAKQTIVVETTKDYDETDHPAFTVCGTPGWRNYDSTLHHGIPFEIFCNLSTNAKEAIDCVNKNTFNLTEMVVAAINSEHESLEESDWQEDISTLSAGKCYTLQASSVDIGTSLGQSLTIIYTNQSQLIPATMIHDPDFFIFSTNPLAMPRIMTIHDKKLW